MADAVDELFTLPPAEFTAARNALVKKLRAEKRRDEAEAVKSLRRPNLPAWTLNQVARAHGDAIDGLLEAGAAVVAAQRRALSGVRESGLREASQRRRDIIDDVWRLASSVLRDAGVDPQAHRQPIAATLEAASVQSDVAAALTAGRLTTDAPAPSGFGDVAGFTLVAPQSADGADDADQPEAGGDGEAADLAAAAAAADARRTAQQARHRADDLAKRAADARRAAVRTADEATRLEQRAAQTRGRADDEAAHAAELAEQAERARADADEAEAEAARLS